MSEEGWRAFLAADDLDDWVVLHGGATAFFALAPLADAARFAESVAKIPDVSGKGLKLCISDAGVTIRLTRDVWQLEPSHIGQARVISQVAREHGAVANREVLQEVQIAIAAKAEAIDLAFWRAVLGYSAMAEDNAVDPLGHGSTVWMQEIHAEKPLRHAMHIDVSVPREQIEARLAAAVAAGGRIVDASHAPSHWTLSDRAGNRVCVCAWPDGGALTDQVEDAPPTDDFIHRHA
jgi:4a-hydroxytetrahydrobiopterin dehydratase